MQMTEVPGSTLTVITFCYCILFSRGKALGVNILKTLKQEDYI